MTDNLNKLLPDLPPMSNETLLQMHRKYATPYLFYRKHRTFIDCYCTSCLKRYRLDLDREVITPKDEKKFSAAININHGAYVDCPECGKMLQCRSEGIGRRNLTEYRYLCYFYNLKDKVFAVCGELISEFDAGTIGDMSMCYRGSRWRTHYAIEYTPRMSRMAYSWLYSGGYEFASGIYEPYIARSYGYEYFAPYNPEVLQDSFLKYVIPASYLTEKKGLHYDGYKPLLYLMYAVRYPAVEMLIKAGGGNIVTDIIDRQRSHKSVICLTGKTAAEVFRTDSNDAAVIRQAMQNGVEVNMDILQCWRKLKAIAKRQHRKYKFEDAVKIHLVFDYNYDNCLAMLRKTGLTPEKLINYFKKQKNKRNNVFSYVSIMHDYKDYIDECIKLGYDPMDDQICRPSDLMKAHTRTSEAVFVIEKEIRERQEQERRIEQERRAAEEQSSYINNYYGKYVDQYEYADNRYCIIVPKSGTEIIEEGKNQHHCVAGYAQRHLTGKLTILFMRDVNNPSAPLYTIEMQDKKLIQIRGFQNSAPTKEAAMFKDKWLKWVALPKNKKHPKKKQHNESEEYICRKIRSLQQIQAAPSTRRRLLFINRS